MQWIWLVVGVGVGLVIGWAASRSRRSSEASGLTGSTEVKPRLSGLGTDVERILKLAEQQAADHVEQARREAERIIAAAHTEAEQITNRDQGY